MEPVTLKCGTIGGIKLVDISNESACLKSPSSVNVGGDLNFDISLPGNLGTLSLAGKLTKVVPMNEKAQRVYLCYVKIGPLDDVNRKILSAYVEYREREKVIDDAFTKWEIYMQHLMLLIENSPSRYFH